ncbi:MAG: nitroreductase family protein [Kiritimatiellae bacterium]|nr:nitroreductase family protein [Kiritimatiellia bacterium]
MEILDVIRNRYSVRTYQERPVEEEKLQRVLEAARLAPSARNMQEARFVVVTEPSLRSALVEAANGQKFVGQAPVVIACCSVNTDYVMRCGQRAHPIDVAIAIDHMTLQAAAEGLGTCWIGSFYPDKVRPLLGIPDTVEVVELLALGYPAGEPPLSKSRLPMKAIAARNHWEQALQDSEKGA